MLRNDVVEACAAGKFNMWAVETIHEALELLTGLPAGKRDQEGKYPPGTLLARAVDRAQEFWLRAATPTSAVLMRAEREEDAAPRPPGPG